MHVPLVDVRRSTSEPNHSRISSDDATAHTSGCAAGAAAVAVGAVGLGANVPTSMAGISCDESGGDAIDVEATDALPDPVCWLAEHELVASSAASATVRSTRFKAESVT